MWLAIVGTRTPSISYEDWKVHIDALQPTRIISGGAVGIDSYAKRYAEEHNIPCTEYLPQYELYGRNAPLQRNTQIVDDCQFLIAFPSAESRGTWDSIRKAEKSQKLLKVINI